MCKTLGHYVASAMEKIQMVMFGQVVTAVETAIGRIHLSFQSGHEVLAGSFNHVIGDEGPDGEYLTINGRRCQGSALLSVERLDGEACQWWNLYYPDDCSNVGNDESPLPAEFAAALIGAVRAALAADPGVLVRAELDSALWDLGSAQQDYDDAEKEMEKHRKLVEAAVDRLREAGGAILAA